MFLMLLYFRCWCWEAMELATFVLRNIALDLVSSFLSYSVWEHLIQQRIRCLCGLQWIRWNGDCLISDFIFLSFSQSEEKIKAVPSLYGILMTLNHMVQQDYFPKSLAPVLSAFVTKWVLYFSCSFLHGS